MDAFVELFQTLWQLVVVLWSLVIQLVGLGLQWALLLVWLAWALVGIDWKKLWPTLAAGAWAPLVLVIVVASLVWSQLDARPCPYTGMPNFWWQLSCVSLIAALTLFCGWLQGVFRCTPSEIELEPPVAEHAHGHH